MIAGIDVSSHQYESGPINYDQVVGAGYVFGVSKRTEGAGSNAYVNPYSDRDWSEMKRIGMARLCYHFARPDHGNSVADELDHYLKHLPVLETGDGVVLDAEMGSGFQADWYYDFLNRLEQAIGFTPMLYSGTWFMQPAGILGDSRFARFGLWFAAYQQTMPQAPAPWGFIAIWQHSSTATVPGIIGQCDVDLFNGDLAALRRYGKPAAKPVPVPVPDPCAQQIADLTVQRDAAYARITAGITALQG